MTTIETLETIRDNLLEGNMTLTAAIVDTVIADCKTLTASLAEVTMEREVYRSAAKGLVPRITTLEAANKGLRETASKVLDGFDKEVFVRSIEHDNEPGWAFKLIPYVAALAELRQALTTPTSTEITDGERLDWLDKNRSAHIYGSFKYHQSVAASQTTWRKAIDAAIKAEKGQV